MRTDVSHAPRVAVYLPSAVPLKLGAIDEPDVEKLTASALGSVALGVHFIFEYSNVDQPSSTRYLFTRSMKQLTAIHVSKMMAHAKWQCGSVIVRGLSGGRFVG
jgi:hypothetical protein